MRNTLWNKTSAIALTAVLTISLSACAPSEEVPAPTTAGITEPIVSETNFTKVLESAKADLAAGDKALDAKVLGARIAGAARAQRSAQYKLKQILGDKYELPAIVIDPKATPITAGTDFPRTAASVNEPNQQQNFQTLSIWVQDSPRAQYTLWGQTYLFPDLQIPKLKANLTDVKTIAGAEKYASDPDGVLVAYTEYLNSGEQKQVKFVADDPIFTQVKEQRAQLKSALGELAEVQTPAAPDETGYKLIPTEDGGAIITGAIKYSVMVTRSKDDATLRLKGEIGALGSGKADDAQIDVKQKLTASYSLLASFYLPPRDAKDATVQVIGATAPTLISVGNEE